MNTQKNHTALIAALTALKESIEEGLASLSISDNVNINLNKINSETIPTASGAITDNTPRICIATNDVNLAAINSNINTSKTSLNQINSNISNIAACVNENMIITKIVDFAGDTSNAIIDSSGYLWTVQNTLNGVNGNFVSSEEKFIKCTLMSQAGYPIANAVGSGSADNGCLRIAIANDDYNLAAINTSLANINTILTDVYDSTNHVLKTSTS